MRPLTGRMGRLLVVALLLLATAAFGVGVAIEKAEEGEHSEPAAVVRSEGGEAGTEAEAASAEEGHEEETLLAVELESTPLVILGFLASLLVAGAVWRLGDRRVVLGLAAAFCLGFAILDGVEVARKWGDETTIALLALLALLAHAGAAAVAGALVAREEHSEASVQ